MSYQDKVAICPYNSNHVFAKEKLFPHLQRCKDKFKNNKPLLFCKNDSSIIFFEEGKTLHNSKCKYCAPQSNNTNNQNKINNNESILNTNQLNMRNKRLNDIQKDNQKTQSIHIDLNISEMSQVQDSRFEYTQKDIIYFDINDESYFMDQNEMNVWKDSGKQNKETNKEETTILY